MAKGLMAKGLIPVTLLKKFRGGNAGETFGYSSALAGKMISTGVARWYNKEAEEKARAAGVTTAFQRAALIDMEAEARAEAKVAEKLAEKDAELKAKDAKIAELEAQQKEDKPKRGRPKGS